MEQYIPKSALVAEIERRTDELYKILPDASDVENGVITISDTINTGKYTALESFGKFINTLEVKEVDLEKFLKEEIEDEWFDSDYGHIQRSNDTTHMTLDDVIEIAKHFFELGLCSTITEEDMKLIWTIGDDIPYMAEEEFYKELLKRFKAQKGE